MIPAGGGPVSADVWRDAETWRERGMPRHYASVRWLLPLNIYGKSSRFHPAPPDAPHPAELTVSRTIHNDLGFPLFLLPLRFKTSDYLYTPESEEPAAGNWVSWTLLWADSGTAKAGGMPGQTWRAAGVPLFFGDVEREAEGTRMRLWQSLWLLGPFFYTQSLTVEPPEGLGLANQEARTTLFLPLAAGGLPGLIVWPHATLRLETGENIVRWDVHGPLAGMLGVLQSYQREDGNEEMLRLVLSGILWMDRKSGEARAAHPRSSAHGPLWTMFAAGRKDGKRAVNLFWIPVVLPGQKSAEKVGTE